MESIAQERYGQQIMPHFASYNANEIKTSAKQAAAWHIANAANDRSRDDAASHDCSSQGNNDAPLELTIKKEVIERPDSAGNSNNSSTHGDRDSTNDRHFKHERESSRSSPSFIPSMTVTTASTLTSSSKPKPSPIVLSPTPPPAHPQLPQLPPSSALSANTSVTLASHMPIPSPTAKHPLHPFSSLASLAGGLQTPLFMSSPMFGGPRTPGPLLHFWSSLSPVTTLSPRLHSSAGGTAFQFPNFGALAYSPVMATFPHTLDSLGTPGIVPSPTSRTIPVL